MSAPIATRQQLSRREAFENRSLPRNPQAGADQLLKGKNALLSSRSSYLGIRITKILKIKMVFVKRRP